MRISKVFVIKVFAIIVFLALLAAPAPRAHALEGEAEATLDVLTTYVWRGINLGGNEGVLQPSIGITTNGFTANLWTDYDLESDEHIETDYTLSYTQLVGKVSIEGGYIYYALDGLADTSELYLSVAADLPLGPTVAVYYDIDQGEGAFVVVSLGHSFEMGNEVSLDLGGSASVNFKNDVMGFDSDGHAFTNLYNGEFSLAINIPVFDGVTISPKVALSVPLSDDADDAIEAMSTDGDSEVLYGGVGVSIGF